MPASDFFEWMVYAQVEPFGDRRGDIHAALISTMLANVNRDPKTKPFKVSDFMPDWERKPMEPQTAQQQMTFMLAIQASQNAALNG